jgi:uncharacterized membrane protein required for colicin V production
LQRLLYHLYLDFFDRLLGGVFALGKGALVVGFGLMLLGVVLSRDSHLLKGSVAAPHLISFARQSLELLPPDFKQRLNDYLKEWRPSREKQQTEVAPLPESQEPQTPPSPRPSLGRGTRV